MRVCAYARMRLFCKEENGDHIQSVRIVVTAKIGNAEPGAVRALERPGINPEDL